MFQRINFRQKTVKIWNSINIILKYLMDILPDVYVKNLWEIFNILVLLFHQQKEIPENNKTLIFITVG